MTLIEITNSTNQFVNGAYVLGKAVTLRECLEAERARIFLAILVDCKHEDEQS